MKFAYHDLGEQRKGSTVVVQLDGSSANVLLLDSTNFGWYRKGQSFLFTGGYYLESPVKLEIPKDGHWYVVVDLGGYKGRVQASVDVLAPEQSSGGREPEGARST